ncbi:MAG TPA: class I fructose-bisphosphate aldolase [Alphaproteobacteria bacterium]|jgi:fructose-bisphosphate aldolase class I|nr:class I fructose-bisphosphate aldolase [Alphaproteobacteria bacterium]
MQEIIQKIFSPNKGILALDWSTKTITEKFAAIGLTSTPELNRKYREMLLTTPGIENYISGVIFFEESVHQGLNKILDEKGIISGIKVDLGGEHFNDVEEATLGLSDLDQRLKEFSKLGLKFTKWRSLFKITDIYPSKEFLEENLNRVVSYAKVAIENGFVPILEPEVSMKGNHTTTRCGEITEQVLVLMFEKLRQEQVDLKNIILKTNMILPGQDGIVRASALEIAEATLRILRRSVPTEVQGIVFLSGGQSAEEVTVNLNEIVKRKTSQDPWDISFSFARALQEEALKTWAGKDENISAAQEVFIKRLERVVSARNGQL